MTNKPTIEYHIAAGKWDFDGVNWKYLDSFTSYEDALEAYKSTSGYSIREFDCVTMYGDYQTRVDLTSQEFNLKTFKMVDGYWEELYS